MIKSTELRRMNLVSTDEDGSSPMFVWQLWDKGAELSVESNGHDDCDYSEEDMYGIPLTSVILGKSMGRNGDLFKLDAFTCYLQNDKIIYYDGAIHVELNFVHELQNLYHALYRKEINIEL